jgi:hypothetical protein
LVRVWSLSDSPGVAHAASYFSGSRMILGSVGATGAGLRNL